MADSLSLQNILQINAAQAVNSLGASAKTDTGGGSDQSFEDVLTKTAEKSTTAVSGKAPVKKDGKDVGEAPGNESGRAKEDVRGNDRVPSSKEAPKDENVSEDTKDAVKEAADTVKEEIKAELGVTEEDIILAMETLGLTFADLLKGENIGALTAELTGNDISEVVSNEELYSSVESIIGVQREVTTELLQEINLTPEEFREVLDSGVLEKEEVSGATEGTDPVLAAAPVDTEEVRPEERIAEGTADRPAEFQKILENTESAVNAENEKAITSEGNTAGTPAETVKAEEVTRGPDRQPEREVEVVLEKVSFEAGETTEEAPAEHKESGGERQFGAESRHQESIQGGNPGVIQMNETAEVFTDNLTEAASETTSDIINSYERVQNIMNQVRDQIRISVNQETTTMEMQLNPESLGKVGLHIESKAGNVTAQFIAQDESVRAALETQVAELKNSLLQQGIKIESVEVTLASREFESNFLNDEGRGNGDSPDREEAERTARLRRINLGAAGAEIPEEEMSEEEALTLRMMRENGGTVDFSA
ncbi:MAG: flagellar hook-length control protein FliK [Lachnospiraceae bacterium]|nr:flagellar hook-length control protein FliK [Lachnospiraceae bacterium]